MASKNPKSTAAAAPTSQTASQTQPPQQPTLSSYFSASQSPPPSAPPPPPPTTQINNVPWVARVMASEYRRREIVQSSLQQLEKQSSARNNGEPVPEFDASAVRVNDFLQQSSSENAVERFCVWDWADDPNVIHARAAMAEIQQVQNIDANAGRR